MNYNLHNEMNLLHWNANGISNYTCQKQLEYILEKKNIKVASLNETYLNETHKVYFKNYVIYRNDRVDSRGGGVALIIRKCIKHKLLPITPTQKIENLSAEIIINNTPIVVTTAYSPKYTSSFGSDILPHQMDHVVRMML